ncbi:hypothetical protein QQJ69_17755 [Proteus mirabilis]|uniref:hypothetical protein n=1 Tax=Proteus mirabilis TaxID=584 RepID=UPI0025562B51|nr:hypothetical protein [Proteus mirabilis]MDL2104980.1 hypothetical protein [Proteus mirabilis]
MYHTIVPMSKDSIEEIFSHLSVPYLTSAINKDSCLLTMRNDVVLEYGLNKLGYRYIDVKTFLGYS